MQKFPLRNHRTAVGGSTNGMPNECRAVTRRLVPGVKSSPVRICNRVAGHNEDTMTWDAVLAGATKSKSWQSQASSSQVDSCGTAAAAVTTQGPVRQQQQQTSARILQVPCIAAPTRTTATTTTTASINANNNSHNRNKDDDDDDDDNNPRCSRSPRTMQAETDPEPGASEAAQGAMPAGAFTAREFMAFEQLRLGDQINFLLFDPYRTLKFLITELKSRLRVVAPDDINAHKILVEIQQAVKRIRGSNATKPTARTTAAGTQGVSATTTLPVGCIPPHGRCDVIKTQGGCLIWETPAWRRTTTTTTPPLPGTGEEISKVQCKRRPNEDAEREASVDESPLRDDESERRRVETFSNFKTMPVHSPRPKLDSSVQAAATTTSNEAQANLKSPTQLLCHLEREKLLLLQRFRTAEMQSIQADLNELHVLIKDQLNGICRSIVRQQQIGRGPFRNKKTRQRTTIEEQPSSSTPSLTAQTSSALSFSELPGDSPATAPEPSSAPVTPANGTANSTKSVMGQKQFSLVSGGGRCKELSSSSLSTRMNAADSCRISDADKVNKTTGEKKSQLHQHRHSGCAKCCAIDTPHCRSGKRIHYSAVDCGGRRRAEPARTSILGDAKSTTKEPLAAMTHRQDHQQRQQCQCQSMTAAQQRTQSIASRVQPAAVPPPCGAGPLLDGLTNAAVKTIIPKPISGNRSNETRGDRHSLPSQPLNSWQCVNPAHCQLKKQICGNAHQSDVNKNNNSRASTVDDNHSNYPQIHGCQKCRANAAATAVATVGRGCGIWPTPMHTVGMNNSTPATAAHVRSFVQTPDVGGVKGDVVRVADDFQAGGDGPAYSTCISTAGDFRALQPGNLHSDAVTKAFQMDFEEFKEFLDEITLSTPRLI